MESVNFFLLLLFFFFVSNFHACKPSQPFPTFPPRRWTSSFPTEHFTILEPQKPTVDISKLHIIWQSTKTKALKLWNVSSEVSTIPRRALSLFWRNYDVPELHKIRRSTDFEALKMWKGSSGRVYYFPASQSRRDTDKKGSMLYIPHSHHRMSWIPEIYFSLKSRHQIVLE